MLRHRSPLVGLGLARLGVSSSSSGRRLLEREAVGVHHATLVAAAPGHHLGRHPVGCAPPRPRSGSDQARAPCCGRTRRRARCRPPGRPGRGASRGESSVRTVVAPARACRRRRSRAAPTAVGRPRHRVEVEAPAPSRNVAAHRDPRVPVVGDAVGVAAQIAENRASKTAGARDPAHAQSGAGCRRAAGEGGRRRVLSRSAEAASTSGSTSTCATCPRACTHASVRPATVTRTCGTRAPWRGRPRGCPGLTSPGLGRQPENSAVVRHSDPQAHGSDPRRRPPAGWRGHFVQHMVDKPGHAPYVLFKTIS